MDSDTQHKTAMTAAERQKKWRAKQSVEFKKSENQRVERLRKSKLSKMSSVQLKEERHKVAARKRRSRLNKHQKCTPEMAAETSNSETNSPSQNAYSRAQTYGKAVKRTARSLPTSPRKRAAVVFGLAKRYGITLDEKMNTQLHPNNRGLSDETVQSIREFFFRTDVVFTMPGMKDEMTVWSCGKKEKLRKHYLTMYLREAYALFKSLYPDLDVSFSKFCQLRPENVLLLKDTPADQCKCRLHENFRLQLKGLQIDYDGSWWKQYLCESNDLNSDCWKGRCSTCSNGKLFGNSFENDMAKPTHWYLWEKNDTNCLQKTFNTGCTGELLELVLDNLPEFQEHVRVKRIQNNEFENDKKTKRVLEIDFAMSYSCEYQSEVQSALWSRASVTLFTAAVFYQGSCKTYLVCSDTKDKGKNTVLAFLLELYDHIARDIPVPDVVEDVIFSDGPSSEFKNKYCVQMLHILSRKLEKNVSWKYFATSHGKGVVDGVGGRSKSLVRQKVMSKSENVVVQGSVDFASLASELMTATSVMHVSQNEIDEKVNALKPWEDVKGVPGIQKMHAIKCFLLDNSSYEIKLWHTSAETDVDIVVKSSRDVGKEICIEHPIQVGSWCVVMYDGEMYPGEVVQVINQEYEVSVMVKTGNLWKWPSKPDKVFYHRSDIVKVVSPPEVAGSRGQFRFEGI